MQTEAPQATRGPAGSTPDQESIDRAISLIRSGQPDQAVAALSAPGGASLAHVGAVVALCAKLGNPRAAISTLEAVRTRIDRPEETLLQLALDLIALGREDEALLRLHDAARLFAGMGDGHGFDRIAALVGTIMDAGVAISHRTIRDIHSLDRWNPGRWGNWFAQCFLRQAGKIAQRQTDGSTLRWIDDLIEDAIKTNPDEAGLRDWIARRCGVGGMLDALQRHSAEEPGVSRMYENRTLDDVSGASGPVENIRFSKTGRGIAREIVAREIGAYAVFQRNYLDAGGWPIPNTEIRNADGSLMLKLNSLGCRGPEPAGPTIAVLGSSETFSLLGSTSWPERAALDGVQMLNAAIEGYPLSRMLARYRFLQKQDFDMLGLVVYAGWHNLIYNQNTEEYWDACLREFLDPSRLTAFCTIATALTPECRTRGLDELIRRGDFVFWADYEPSAENIARLSDKIDEYNAFIRRFCMRHGAVLVDLNTPMQPRCYEEIPVDFFDVNHFRASAYDKLAGILTGALAEPVRRKLRERALAERCDARPAATPPRPAPTPKAPQDPKHYIYSLW